MHARDTGPVLCRIAMWSGPRNISTALMRAFENRADTAVVDEPFYGCYLKATGLDHPGREQIIASMDCDWQSVARALSEDAPAGASIFYQKHMCQHILPELNLAFSDTLHNCFLIREPQRMIASYARIRPQFTLEELGLPQQLALFRRVCDRLGAAPPVIDSAQTLANPEAVLRALCARLDIAFSPQMLHWPAGRRDSDGVWAPHWYAAVERSTGWGAPEDQGPAPELAPAHAPLLAEAQRIYAELRAHLICSEPGTQAAN